MIIPHTAGESCVSKKTAPQFSFINKVVFDVDANFEGSVVVISTKLLTLMLLFLISGPVLPWKMILNQLQHRPSNL